MYIRLIMLLKMHAWLSNTTREGLIGDNWKDYTPQQKLRYLELERKVIHKTLSEGNGTTVQTYSIVGIIRKRRGRG